MQTGSSAHSVELGSESCSHYGPHQISDASTFSSVLGSSPSRSLTRKLIERYCLYQHPPLSSREIKINTGPVLDLLWHLSAELLMSDLKYLIGSLVHRATHSGFGSSADGSPAVPLCHPTSLSHHRRVATSEFGMEPAMTKRGAVVG